MIDAERLGQMLYELMQHVPRRPILSQETWCTIPRWEQQIYLAMAERLIDHMQAELLRQHARRGTGRS